MKFTVNIGEANQTVAIRDWKKKKRKVSEKIQEYENRAMDSELISLKPGEL